MSKGSARRPGIGFSKNYKGSRVKGGSWVQDPVTGKLVSKADMRAGSVNAPVVHGKMESFVSPVTKELITDRGQLRRHNKKHGITNMADYSEEFISKRAKARNDVMTGNTPQALRERRELISRELTKQGIR